MIMQRQKGTETIQGGTWNVWRGEVDDEMKELSYGTKRDQPFWWK
jgi:hypothetical protein